MAKPLRPETVCISTRIDHASRCKLALLCEIDATNISGFLAAAVGTAISKRLAELGRHDEINYATHVPNEPPAAA